jgi:hypothetical protein
MYPYTEETKREEFYRMVNYGVKSFCNKNFSKFLFNELPLFNLDFSWSNLSESIFACSILRLKLDKANVLDVRWPSWFDVLRCNFGDDGFSEGLTADILLYEKQHFDTDKSWIWSKFEAGDISCPFIGIDEDCRYLLIRQIFDENSYNLLNKLCKFENRGPCVKELLKGAKIQTAQELAKRMLKEKCYFLSNRGFTIAKKVRDYSGHQVPFKLKKETIHISLLEIKRFKTCYDAE